MADPNVAEALQWLQRELAGSAISFEQGSNAARVAGFTLLARWGPRRAAFAWNAHDQVLEVSYAGAEDDPLVHDAYISVPNGEGLYEEIASEATSLLAV